MNVYGEQLDRNHKRFKELTDRRDEYALQLAAIAANCAKHESIGRLYTTEIITIGNLINAIDTERSELIQKNLTLWELVAEVEK